MEGFYPMSVPTHFKFVFRGVFLNTPETWSFSTHMSRDNDAGLDAELTDISVESVDDALFGLIGSGLISSRVEVSDWRAYKIGTNGNMEGNAPLLREFEPGEFVGQAAGVQYPPQVALVVTTVGPDRGPGRFGRFYLPGPNKPLGADARISIAHAQEYVTVATTFLKSLSDSIDLEALQSAEGLNISPGPPGSPTGTRQTVDHVEVGRVYDTLRNRRKSLLEERELSGHIDW
jgi:hypothetical protein